MPSSPDVTGMAALAICEALLLAMNDRKILPETEIMGILHDAAAAHTNATIHEGQSQLHMAAAALIQQMIDGGNSVRHRKSSKKSG